MLMLLRDAAIGRKVRAGMTGILDQERFAGRAPAAVVELATEHAGSFEIVVRRKR